MNIKDVISAVVTLMKPTISFTGAVLSNPTSLTVLAEKSVLNKLFVGQRIRLTKSDASVDYGTVALIGTTSFVITIPATSLHTNPYDTAGVVLVFDHGHPLEIVNRVKEYSESDTLKFESFPRICLFHDFEEKMTYQKNVTCTIVIVTDTSPTYTASQRYTYSFDPTLTPLYDLFIEMLGVADNVETTEGNYFKHTKIDRLYWGKNGLYGNSGNVFNDYIDAIEINNLELIINNC